MRKNKIDQAEYDYIQSLKAEQSSGPMVENNRDLNYKIKVVGRGEMLFYQEGERALLCEIQIRNDLVYQNSIKRWDDGTPILDSDKQKILDRIINYFRVYQQAEAKLV